MPAPLLSAARAGIISSMVSRDELWHLLGRRPFQPVRVMLVGGHAVDVTRTAQAVVTPRQLIVGIDAEDRFRWIPLNQIERIQPFESRQPAP